MARTLVRSSRTRTSRDVVRRTSVLTKQPTVSRSTRRAVGHGRTQGNGTSLHAPAAPRVRPGALNGVARRAARPTPRAVSRPTASPRAHGRPQVDAEGPKAGPTTREGRGAGLPVGDLFVEVLGCVRSAAYGPDRSRREAEAVPRRRAVGPPQVVDLLFDRGPVGRDVVEVSRRTCSRSAEAKSRARRGG